MYIERPYCLFYEQKQLKSMLDWIMQLSKKNVRLRKESAHL